MIANKTTLRRALALIIILVILMIDIRLTGLMTCYGGRYFDSLAYYCCERNTADEQCHRDHYQFLVENGKIKQAFSYCTSYIESDTIHMDSETCSYTVPEYAITLMEKERVLDFCKGINDVSRYNCYISLIQSERFSYDISLSLFMQIPKDYRGLTTWGKGDLIHIAARENVTKALNLCKDDLQSISSNEKKAIRQSCIAYIGRDLKNFNVTKYLELWKSHLKEVKTIEVGGYHPRLKLFVKEYLIASGDLEGALDYCDYIQPEERIDFLNDGKLSSLNCSRNEYLMVEHDDCVIGLIRGLANTEQRNAENICNTRLILSNHTFMTRTSRRIRRPGPIIEFTILDMCMKEAQNAGDSGFRYFDCNG